MDIDPAGVAHFVDQDVHDVRAAYEAGTNVEALCGYVWVPFRPAEGLPFCVECVTVSHLLYAQAGQ